MKASSTVSSRCQGRLDYCFGLYPGSGFDAFCCLIFLEDYSLNDVAFRWLRSAAVMIVAESSPGS